MNKKLATLLVLVSLSMAGLVVAAEPAPSQAAEPEAQSMIACPQMKARAQADPAMREKIQKFYKDTEKLRKQIAMKRAELEAVVNAAQADPATAGKMAGELFDLQANLRTQAQAAGLSQFGPGMGMGGGFGRGGGRHGHGGAARW